mgnify:CR=1 FL=1
MQLVSHEVGEDNHKVLIAIDAKREDAEYQSILDKVIAYGKAVATTAANGELHVVYAYSGSEDFRYVTDIAKRVDIDTTRVHAVGGKPDQAIVETARDINADMIIIGLSTKSTLTNRIFGSMTGRLLNNIDHDILIVIPDHE